MRYGSGTFHIVYGVASFALFGFVDRHNALPCRKQSSMSSKGTKDTSCPPAVLVTIAALLDTITVLSLQS